MGLDETRLLFDSSVKGSTSGENMHHYNLPTSSVDIQVVDHETLEQSPNQIQDDSTTETECNWEYIWGEIW